MKKLLILLFVSALAFFGASPSYAYDFTNIIPSNGTISGSSPQEFSATTSYSTYDNLAFGPIYSGDTFPVANWYGFSENCGAGVGGGGVTSGVLSYELPSSLSSSNCSTQTADWVLYADRYVGGTFIVYEYYKFHNTGTWANPVWVVLPGAPPFLGFPLPSLTPYTAGISGVVDHSVSTGFNCANNVVTAYTGEQGESGNGESIWSTTATGSGCSGSLYGLVKASGTFSLGGQYDSYDTGGIDHNVYLFYDGHTGYDYPATNGTQVNAAAGGTAYHHNWGPNNTYHDMKVVHGNGYTTYYLHLSYREEINGTTISKGTKIGKVGSNHLHFTVKHGNNQVDPYGWTGTGADPLQIDGHDNICLWDACP